MVGLFGHPRVVSGARDSLWASVKLVCNAQGLAGRAAFSDGAARHGLVGVGNAQLSSSQTFGGRGTTSGLLDGTGDSVYAVDTADFEIGTGAYTGEMFVRFAALPSASAATLMSQYSAGSNEAFTFNVLESAGVYTLRFGYTTDGSTDTQITATITPSIDTDYFAAFTISSSSVRLYFGPSNVATAPQVGSTGTLSGSIFNSTANFTIGDVASGGAAANIYFIGPRLTAAARSTGSTIPIPSGLFPVRG